MAENSVSKDSQMELQETEEHESQQDEFESDKMLQMKGSTAKQDKGQKTCTFQTAWKQKYPWIEYNELLKKMSCSYCERYAEIAKDKQFVLGTDRVEFDIVQNHHVNTTHIECMKQFERDEESEHLTTEQIMENLKHANAEWQKAHQNLPPEMKATMRKYFLLANMMAKTLMSFSLTESFCGLFTDAFEADLNPAYGNAQSCKEFTHCIDHVILSDLKTRVLESRYVSFVIGGNAMVHEINDWESVFIRYLHEGEIKTDLLDMVKLTRLKETSVKTALQKSLRKIDLTLADLLDLRNDKPTLVSIDFATILYYDEIPKVTRSLISKTAPWVIQIHHIPYELEMAVLELVNSQEDMRKFNESVLNLFEFYVTDWRSEGRNGPGRKLHQTCEELMETPFYRIRGIDMICFSSQFKVLTILQKNIKDIYKDLKQRSERMPSNNNNDEDSDDLSFYDYSDEFKVECKRHLGEITCKKFIMLLHLMCDVTKLLEKFAEKNSSLDLFDGPGAVDFLTTQLESLKENDGKHLKEFRSKFDREKFKGIRLKGDNPSESLVTDTIDNLITNINRRFENFRQSPLKAFQAFNYTEYPNDGSWLKQHGHEDLQSLIDYYIPLLNVSDRNQILSEYDALKIKLREHKSSDMSKSKVFSLVVKYLKEESCELLKLLQIMQVVSPSVKEWENSLEKIQELKREIHVRAELHRVEALRAGREYDSDEDEITTEEARMKVNISCAGGLKDEDLKRAIGFWATCNQGAERDVEMAE